MKKLKKGVISFGDYVTNIMNININDIWSDKNTISPYEVSKGNKQKVWLKCLDDPTHPDYDIACGHYTNGHGCPYCKGKRTCYTNSFGYSNPELESLWSDKNEMSIFEIAPMSKKSVWWKCENGLHEDYMRNLTNANKCNYKCPICSTPTRFMDFTGMTFGRWTVLGFDEEKTKANRGTTSRDRYWICQCSCENHTRKSISSGELVIGDTKSCGCYIREMMQGETHPNWKGGITEGNKKDRNAIGMFRWTKDVYAKDNYTCQCCGRTDKKIHAHHIYNFADNKDKMMDLDNGISLCIDCHLSKSTNSFHHVYGRQSSTPEQLVSYINTRRKELGIIIPFNIEEYQSGCHMTSQKRIQGLKILKRSDAMKLKEEYK